MCWKDFHSKVSTVGLTVVSPFTGSKGGGDYKQFCSNRVRKIQEKEYIQWRHVSTRENRGGKIRRCSDL